MTSRQADAKNWSFICDSHAQKGHFSQEVMIFRYKDRHTLALYIHLYILEYSVTVICDTFTIYIVGIIYNFIILIILIIADAILEIRYCAI